MTALTEPLKIAYSPCPNDPSSSTPGPTTACRARPRSTSPSRHRHHQRHGRARRVRRTEGVVRRAAVRPRRVALLPCGARWGGAAALVLTRDAETDLTGRTVAVPSERSTEYLLFRLWAADTLPGGVGEVVVMPSRDHARRTRGKSTRTRHPRGRFTTRTTGSTSSPTGEHWERRPACPSRGRDHRQALTGEERLTALAAAAVTSSGMAGRPEIPRPTSEHARKWTHRRRPATRPVRERGSRPSRRRLIRGDQAADQARRRGARAAPPGRAEPS